MKKIIPLIIITLLTIASCHRSKDIPEERRLFQFLGKSVVLNNAICDQIASIAEQDKMLSYNDSILQIGDVKWRINIMSNGIALMTSVQPDDPKMIEVVTYLKRIYGKPYHGENAYSMKWSSSDKTGSRLVHLRRVNSEEGGTFLFFY